MKILFAAAGAALLLCTLNGFAETGVACGETLTAALRSRAALTIHSRPAGLEIVGTDQETIRVSCTSNDMESAQQARLRFTGMPDSAELTIEGGYVDHGNLQIRIEVPRKTNLRIEMSAGEVKVDEIAGDKDIDLTAGRIAISSDHGWNYRIVHASVSIGSVNAAVYGANKGGFFRNFTKREPGGEYELRAHVMTGEIDLIGANAKIAAK